MLADDGPGFSAFIVDNSTNITSDAVARLLEYAEQGFVILFIGGLPEASPYYSIDSDAYVKDGVSNLLTYPSVRNLSSEADVVDALKELDVFPAAENLSPCPILYTHRLDKENLVDYYWVYNSDLNHSHATEASLRGSGVPYTLNAWTGVISPIVNYTTTGERFNLWFDLKSNQSTIVAFASASFFSNVTTPAAHVVNSTVEYLNISSDGTYLVAKSALNTSQQITLSDNRSITFDVDRSLPSPTALSPWNLVIQDWQPGPDPWTNYSSTFTYHDLNLDELIPWYNITGLENTSGIGTYTTNFTWTSSSVNTGAWLDLGPVFNTVKLFVNSQWTGPIDVTNAVVDIGAYMTNGTNRIKIETASTLRNRLLQVNVTQSWEQAKYATTYGGQPYGLSAPVTLIPYREFKIAL